VNQILKTLLSHWRRKPIQLAALLAGLTIATALWSGVQALNAQAKQSYADAAQMLGGDSVNSLARPDGARFPQETFGALRRAGWPVAPVIEGRIRIKNLPLRVVGIDSLSLPRAAEISTPQAGRDRAAANDPNAFQNFLTPPWQSLIAPKTLDLIGGVTTSDTGATLPPFVVTEQIPAKTLVMDIAAAQAVLGSEGEISRLLVDPDKPVSSIPLAEATTVPLQQTPESEASDDLDRLTDSFHLNLTAFGMLAFLVGLFIVYSAITLAFEQRLPMLRTMRACGVSARGLTTALLVELLTLALISGVVGVLLGYLIAAALMPDVAASLGGLYGAQVPGALSLAPSWWVTGLGMSLLGALGASAYSLFKAYRMPPLATGQRFAWREAQQRWLRWQAFMALGLLVVSALLAYFGNGLGPGFASLAALLLAGALALPPFLSLILRRGEAGASSAISEWFWADSRMQISGLSVALMAMLLALATNIGVGTMVDGFRKTFVDWLDQRLIAEIYIIPGSDARKTEIMSWLDSREEVTAQLPKIESTARIENWPVTIVGFVDHGSYRNHWPMKAKADDIWDAVANDEAIVVSEQLAQRLSLRLEDTLALGEWQPRVVGIYPDYGNPRGQISADIHTLRKFYPNALGTGLGLRVDPEAVPPLMTELRERFDLSEGGLTDQASIKAFSKSIFEKTFAVTTALNVLTMLIAGFAMFMSLLTLSEMRLPQLAPLWAGGLTRKQLARLELVKTCALALFTALLAVPLGLAVAWCLVSVVNVQAFGWRLPFHAFPVQWVVLVIIAVVTAFLASLLPTLRLRTIAPMRLLRVFANER